MTDVAHPAAPPKRRKRLAVRARSTARHAPVSFAELVQAHYMRQQALEQGKVYAGEAEERYREFEAAFQRQQGRIVNAYWCTSMPSGVALTVKQRGHGQSPDLFFHRVSDWATKEEPEIADCLHQCDALAVKASQVLYGVRLKICMHLVMASAGHLLSLVDAPSSHDSQSKKAVALKHARKELDGARAYYNEAANGQGQIYYFLGVMGGLAVLAMLALALGHWVDLPHIDNREFFGCLTAGALGALVSVISRIGAGRFALHCDVGRLYPTFLGTLRPVIGAVFGVALYFAVKSGLLDLFKLPTESDKRFYFLLVIAFVAGFSERWARDTLLGLTKAVPGGGGKEPAKPAPDTS